MYLDQLCPSVVSLLVTRRGLVGKWCSVTPLASICFHYRLIWRNTADSIVGALIRGVGLGAGAFEASVRILGVVKGHAVHAQHMSLEVTLLGGAVGTVTALEGSRAWRRKQRKKINILIKTRRTHGNITLTLCWSHVPSQTCSLIESFDVQHRWMNTEETKLLGKQFMWQIGHVLWLLPRSTAAWTLLSNNV